MSTEPTPTNSGGFLGQSYSYQKYINPPNKVGITSKATISGVANDIVGLSSYGELLIKGGGKASATGRPLGDKYWYYTGGKCNAVTDDTGKDLPLDSTKQTVNRWIYINNVPTGGLGIGTTSGGSDNKGLLPGAIQDLFVFSRLSIMNAFSGETTPNCQSVNLETIDSNNNKGRTSHYVALLDLENMNECTKKSPGSSLYNCKDSFTNMNINTNFSNNIIDNFFLLCICIAGLYVLYYIHLHQFN